jgi:glycosyltransferase involved in cell wall biosynthesis
VRSVVPTVLGTEPDPLVARRPRFAATSERLGVKPLRLCALVPYPLRTVPSQRFRLEQWQPILERQGILLSFFPFASEALMRCLHEPGHLLAKSTRSMAAVIRRLWLALHTGEYDGVVIHRAACLAGPAIVERLLKAVGPRIVFDFDDAIHLLHTSQANRSFGWLKFPEKTAELCRMSAHVVAANSSIAAFAREHNPRVTIVPSSVDTDRYAPRPRRNGSGRAVVGWTGSSTSQVYLELFAPVLREIVETMDVEIRIHSDRRPELPGVPYSWRPWSACDEVEALSEFDIGLMPMPDDAWARGKSAMKALLYMAMGIPAVCSPVGTNREVIRHGENGLLASTAAEWKEALGALVADAELRQRIGQAGREKVENGYSMRQSAVLFAEVAREAFA